MPRSSRRLSLIAAALGATVAAGCGTSFKTCSDAKIELANSQQSRATVHVVPPDEDPSPDNLLAPGESRDIELCLNKGDRRGFRVVLEDATLATATCVASRADYEALVIRVSYGPGGLSCEGW
jgi:hypothetical protein